MGKIILQDGGQLIEARLTMLPALEYESARDPLGAIDAGTPWPSTIKLVKADAKTIERLRKLGFKLPRGTRPSAPRAASAPKRSTHAPARKARRA